MRINGIKIQITATLFVLLMVGLLLGNLVFFVFWQRSLIRAEVMHTDAVLDYINSGQGLLSADNTQPDKDKLESTCQMIGNLCKDAFFYDSRLLSDNGNSLVDGNVARAVNRSAETTERTVVLAGSIWRAISGGRRSLVIAEPIMDLAGENDTAVFILELKTIYQAIWEDQKTILVYLLVNALILSVIGLFRMVNRIVKPIDRIVEITDTYRTADNLIFADSHDANEFRRLNTALNNMVLRIESDKDKLRETIQTLEATNQELIQAQTEVVRAEKLASVGRLSAGFAHEIGNPIGIVQGYIELLKQDDITREEKEQFGDKAVEELNRIQVLIRQLLDFAGSTTQKEAEVVVDSGLLQGVLDLVLMRKQSKYISIETDIEPNLIIYGNREGLQQVFLNCVLNAIDAIESRSDTEEGTINFSARTVKQQEAVNGSKILITIKDDGIGLEDDQIGQIFDPFYTTKEPGKGTGLGLFVSISIIEAHGGDIQLSNNTDTGATVSIIFPCKKNEKF